MARRAVDIANSYKVLGLEEGASFEEVKSAYKQLALQTHPDKNPDNPNATARFQEVSAAFAALKKRLGRPSGHDMSYEGDSDSGSDDYGFYSGGDDDSDPDVYYFYVDPHIFLHIFEDVFRRQDPTHGKIRRALPEETEEQYQARLQKQLQDRKEADERRIEERKRHKERIDEERERERIRAEKRQQEKSAQKKAQAEVSRKAAEQKVRNQLQQTQTQRSATFASARNGDADKVKLGIFKNNVDAAGGEVKRGAEEFVKCPPKDSQETLLHIAAGQGDLELVKWLVDHNAEPDQRNSSGLTAFHTALQKGHVAIVKYFFKELPPSDIDYQEIYKAPPSTNLLRLALDSATPELVWFILEKKQASTKHITDGWTWICSEAATKALAHATKSEKACQGLKEELQDLLMAYGKFTPPASPKLQSREPKRDENASKTPKRLSSVKPQSGLPTPTSTSSIHELSPRASPSPSDDIPHTPRGSTNDSKPRQYEQRGSDRGRGRGRGKGRGRGNGRGRGRGTLQT